MSGISRIVQNEYQSNKNYQFANLLRGIAALSVVFGHLFGSFWFTPAVVSSVLHVPSFQTPHFFIAFIPGGILNYGPLGVALFFLVSGFVIPFSLEGQNSIQFLISRFFRIWPTYLIGFLLSLACLIFVNFYFKQSFPYNLSAIFSNIFLVNSLMGMSSIDAVNWTLAVEVKFYLLLALFPFIIRNPLILLSAAACFTILNLFPPQRGIVCDISFSCVMMTFMLIGTLFSMHASNRINNKIFLLSISSIMAMFIIQCDKNTLANPMASVLIINYILALLIFSFSYFLFKEKKYQPGKQNIFENILTRLADISYPLYLTHAIFGYTYLRIFIIFNNNPWIALSSCLFIILGISMLIHKFIEVPSNLLGKRLAKHIGNKLTVEAPTTAS